MDQLTNSKQKIRILVIIGIAIVLTMIIGGRLYSLQISQQSKYRDKIVKQSRILRTIEWQYRWYLLQKEEITYWENKGSNPKFHWKTTSYQVHYNWIHTKYKRKKETVTILHFCFTGSWDKTCFFKM